MIDQSLREEIQGYYSSFLAAKQFQPRYGQKLMVAELARRLTSEGGDTPRSPIALIEAGTGTGKTVGYTLTAATIAAAREKTLIIATATVALQEQLVLRDLPDIQQQAGMHFSFALAKGRRRYVCLAKLDAALAGQAPATSDFFPDEKLAFGVDQAPLLTSLLEAYGKGSWDGDRDSLSAVIDDPVWRGVSTDRSQCTNRQCSFFSQCAFFKAREALDEVDVVVTNHDLLLADLSSADSQILPSPEAAIYVFDEAHHLVDKARSQWSGFASKSGQSEVLAAASGLTQSIKEDLSTTSLGALLDGLQGFNEFDQTVADVQADLAGIFAILGSLEDEAEPQGEVAQYRFPGGWVPDELRDQAQYLGREFDQLDVTLQGWRRSLEQSISSASIRQRQALEQLVPILGGFSSRFSAASRLWQLFSVGGSLEQSPSARWLDFRGDDVLVHCTPIAVADQLYDHLWSRCAGALLTSATLAVGRDFSLIATDLGLPEDVEGIVVPSPFDYQRQGRLRVPKMQEDPSNPTAHTNEIATLIPELIAEYRSALVLFTSWRQFFNVVDALPVELKARCLLQGDASKAELLKQHRARIDAGDVSYLLGLQSFAEGVDLPGDYCLQVVIAKLPFSVPNDPVGATQQEWVEAQGGNAFAELMIPHAALRLTQAAGRLLRTEQDHGVVTILDSRLVTKRYGRQLIAALPPFQWEQG